MSIRFTETNKWKNQWFSELSPKAKLAWLYINDDCDHCGVWIANYRRASFELGFDITKENITTWFSGIMEPFNNDESYFIPSFVALQQPKGLNCLNNAHKSIINFLEQNQYLLGAKELLTRSWPGALYSMVPYSYSNGNSKGRIHKEGEGAPCTKVLEEKTKPPGGAEILFNAWNQNRGLLPAAITLSKKRIIHANARWNENPDLPYWLLVIEKLAASKFCNGDNDRNWKADFDFLIKQDTHVRAREGKYDSYVTKSTLTPKLVV